MLETVLHTMVGSGRKLGWKAASTLSTLARVVLWTVLSFCSLYISIGLYGYWSETSGVALLVLQGLTLLVGFCSVALLYLEPFVLWAVARIPTDRL